jgi:hypothetical protein
MRSMVEGVVRSAANRTIVSATSSDPARHVDCRNAHHRNSVFLEPRVLSRVALRAIGGVVTDSISPDRSRIIVRGHDGRASDASRKQPTNT